MGKGVITGEPGKGLYSVYSDYGESIAAKRLTDLQARRSRVEQLISNGTVDNNQLSLAVGIAESNVDIAIDAYQASDNGSDEKTLLDEATVDFVIVGNKLQASSDEIGILQLELANIIVDIDEIQSSTFSETHQLWCADHTTQASGEVATIEINGEPPLALIAPGANPASASDGQLTEREVMSPEQAFINAAILPGWQKFNPNYRSGQITAIDRETDTCSVSLDTAKSSAQNLNINQVSTLSGVPIVYMSCNSVAFEVWDAVIVSFSGDWGNPTVIGFVDNPRLCFPDKIFCLIEPYTAQSQFVAPFETGDTIGGSSSFDRGYGTNNGSWEAATEGNVTGAIDLSIEKYTLRIRLDVMWTQRTDTGDPFQIASPLYLSPSHGLTVHLGPTYAGNRIVLRPIGFGDGFDYFIAETNSAGSESVETYNMTWLVFGTDTVGIDRVFADAWIRSHFEPPPSEITFDVDGNDVVYELESIGPPPDDIEGDRFVEAVPGEPVGNDGLGDIIYLHPYKAGVGDDGPLGIRGPSVIGVVYKVVPGQ